MTTEATETVQRSVTKLVELDTFQGMTDAEIQSLIDYYVQLSRTDLQAQIARTEAQSNMENIAVYCADASETIQSMLQSILEGTTHYVAPELKTVTD